MICSKPVRDRRRECKSRMSAIYIHLNRVREANYTLPDIEDGALLVRSRIQRTKKEIPDYILSKYQIGQRLSIFFQYPQAASPSMQAREK